MCAQENLTNYLTVSEIIARCDTLKELAQQMRDGIHYGTIPGAQKPALRKPGVELLLMMHHLGAFPTIECVDLGGGHREYRVVCTLRDVRTNAPVGAGVGVCSTMESRYRYRMSERVCPACGKPAIIKGREEYGGGWICFSKRGGCGAKFADNDVSITQQQSGRIENAELADLYNTALKMAKKRALTDAVLTATATSSIFDQDTEDEHDTAEESTTTSVGVSESHLRALFAACRDAKISHESLKAFLAHKYHITSSRMLTVEQYHEVMQFIKDGTLHA